MSNIRWCFEISKDEKDWMKVKELYVRAFMEYPLYVQMQPDKNKRPEFLRKYLEANFDVAVRHGKGKMELLRYKVDENKHTDRTTSQDIVAAILFVPPADDGIAWALQDDSAYWKAYEKENISEACLRRVIAYETWEQNNITAVVRRAKAPILNCLFCAIDPDFNLHGLGTSIAEVAGRFLLQHEFLKRDSVNIPKELVQKTLENTGRIKTEHTAQTELQNPDSSCQDSSLLHSMPSLGFKTKENIKPKERFSEDRQHPNNNNKLEHQAAGLESKNQLPLIGVVCHSYFTSYFYQKNGLQHVADLVYTVEENPFPNTIPIHVLMLDSMKSGMANDISLEFKKQLKSKL